ncbi:MAG: SpoIID/LytB domain-containing protein, partial [Anaerotignaceae bacterium]
MTRYIIVFAIYCSMCLLVLPMGVSGYYINSEEATTAYLEKTEELEETQETQETQETEEVQETVIPVDLSQKVINFFNKKENTTTLENYVIGVVAAEMPALFNEEALKAQAVASRT